MSRLNGKRHELQGSESVFSTPQSAAVVESAQQRKPAATVAREIEFALLPDGRMVDLIRSTRQPANLEFLVWQNGNVWLTSQIESGGELLVPPKVDPSVVSAIRLPTGVKPCPPIGELFTLLMDCVEKFVEIAPQYSFLNAASILCSWVADRLSVVPYLSVCGPPESGKTTLLRLLHCLCRRALHTSNITPASLYRLAPQVRPTLLIDEIGFARDRTSRDFQRLLRGGNRQGSRVLSNGKALELFGPKVLASRIPLDDAALVSRTIHITMAPSNRDVPTLDLDAEEKLADALQPMLETFRLRHYQRVAASQYHGFLKFPPRLRDCARALAAPMLGNAELEQRLVGALESQAEAMQSERFSQPEWLVMSALYRQCHSGTDALWVRGLTEEVNRIICDEGEKDEYKATAVGRILRQSLGFSAVRWGNGYRLALTSAVARKIHVQAKTMGLLRVDMLPSVNVGSGFAGEPPCDLCKEFGLMFDRNGRKLLNFDDVEKGLGQCTNCGAKFFSVNQQRCPRCNTPKQKELQNPPSEPSADA